MVDSEGEEKERFLKLVPASKSALGRILVDRIIEKEAQNCSIPIIYHTRGTVTSSRVGAPCSESSHMLHATILGIVSASG